MSISPPETEKFYALETLYSHKAAILSASGLMESSRKTIDKCIVTDNQKAKDSYDILQNAHTRILELIGTSVLCLREIGEIQLADYGSALREQLKRFNLMTRDYSTLIDILGNYTSQFPEEATVNASIIGRLMNSVKMGYYPTDAANIGCILHGIAFPDGVVTNLLDPCCGEGAALKKLAVGNNCMTYGAEIDEARATKAQDELHRVAFGSFFHSRISHEAFHIVFLNPPYLSVINKGGGRSRDEKRFLIDSIPHLMYGGLIVYIIPYYRLTADICRILCDNFDDISVHRFTEKEFLRFKQVVVIGKRIPRIDGSSAAEQLEASVYAPGNIPLITDLEMGRYMVPAHPKKVQTFKGAEFNVVELQRQLKQSKSFEDILTKKKADMGIRRPPLPFSFSQLGLIGGSGLINGLIECDNPHIIKGRIVKVVNATRMEHRNSKKELIYTAVTETASNKMIFNILTPQGYKSLA